MTRRFTTAAFLLLATLGYTADFLESEPVPPPTDHLVPVSWWWDSDFDAVLRKTLVVEWGRYGEMIVIPSFSPPYAVSVYHKRTNEVEHFYATLTEAPAELNAHSSHEQGSQSVERSELVVKRYDVEIPRSLAVAVQRAWATLLRQTRYAKGYSDGHDGEISRFSVFVRGHGFLTGEIWSPESGLTAAIRVAGDHLVDLCRTPAHERSNVLKRLQAELEQLEADALKAEHAACATASTPPVDREP